MTFLRILFLGGCLAWICSCTSAPPSQGENDHSKTLSKTDSPSNSSQDSKKDSSSQNFDYEKYIEKHKLESQAKAKEKETEKNKSEYNQILQEMAHELKKEWVENQGKVEVQYQEAWKCYEQMDFAKAEEKLIQILQIDQKHEKSKNLYRRIRILQNQQGVLLKESREILEEEKRIFEKIRIPFLQSLMSRGNLLVEEKKYQEAEEVFARILWTCQWANQVGVSIVPLKELESKAKEYKEALSKRKKKT